MPLFPFNHLDDNLIAYFREGLNAGVTGIRDDEILNDTGIVWNDVVGVTSFFKIAYDGFTGALKDADDAHIGFFVGVVFGAALGFVAAPTPAPPIEFFMILLLDPGEDMVAVECDAGVLGINRMPGDAFFTGIGVGDEEGRAALSELDAPADEIGVVGKAETIFFYTGNFAGLKEALKDFTAAFGGILVELEDCNDFLLSKWHIVRRFEEGEDFFSQIH